MRKIALPVITLLLLFIPACKQQIVNRLSEPKPSVMPREGDYLSTAYIDELNRTRSPLKGGPRLSDSSQLGLVSVKKDGDLWRLMPIFNFHEGGAEFVLRPDGSVSVKDTEYISHLTVSVKNANSFRLGFDMAGQSFKPSDYVFVQDATAYVAKAVLVGSYRDQLGHVYRFQEDGTAVFHNRKFRYEIGIDHVLTDFDYFMEMGPKGVALSSMAFKWEAGSLHLFRVKEDANGFDAIVDKQPLLSLQRVQ